MSLDLVAVQRDAALLDALAQRADDLDVHGPADPVAGLLAALVADVDDGLADVAGPDGAPLIPAQRGRQDRPDNVSTLPLAPVPTGRRHLARAVAALVVTAAVLSVSGVAAAVSGDPLTPYKRVIDVVRSGYDEVVPKSLVVPKQIPVPPDGRKAVTVVAARGVAAQSHTGARASRSADGRHAWSGRVAGRSGWTHRAWGPAGRGGQVWDGRRHASSGDRGTARSGDTWYGRQRSGSVDWRSTSQGGRDSTWRGGQRGDPRR